jgi:hypothetical protein
MGLRNAKPQKGGKARIPFLGLVTVVTVSYFIEPMGRKNAKRMQLGGMQVILSLLSLKRERKQLGIGHATPIA